MSQSEISAEYPFESNYADILGSKMHYIEKGTGDPILFLHGNPTSSYLWRNIIPHVAHLGRCIAPDLIGMGRSDKPDIEYRFRDHAAYLDAFIEALGLKNITLVIHDWGSALGFYYAARNEANVKAIAFMEAIVKPFGSWDEFHPDFQNIFRNFRTPEVGWDMIVNQNFFIERVLPGAVVRDLTAEEMDRYREPYTDPQSRKPLWRWPNEIPIEGKPEDVAEIVRSYSDWLKETEIGKLMIHGKPGTLLPKKAVLWCRENLINLETVKLDRVIHFPQEDYPHQIGTEIAQWYAEWYR